MKFIPYLTFEGNAEEAISFYTHALGGQIVNIMRYKEAPSTSGMPPIPNDYMEKILHASISVKGEMLYISDTFPGSKITEGDKVEINIDCESQEELRRTFDKLSVGGNISMPVDEVFWGSIFGTLQDKYGVGWSLNYDIPQ